MSSTRDGDCNPDMFLNPGIKPNQTSTSWCTGQHPIKPQGPGKDSVNLTFHLVWPMATLKTLQCLVTMITEGPIYWSKKLWQRTKTNLTLDFQWVKSCYKESSVTVKNLSCDVSWENESICEIQPHDLNLFFLYANIINQSSRPFASKVHVLRMFQGHSLWLPLI